MAKEEQKVTQGINALGAKAAYNLANVTKTKPQYGAITPKWLTKFLEFKGLETGIYRVNKVVEGNYPEGLFVAKVNVAFDSELVEEYKVTSAPTFLLFRNGEEVERFSGVLKKEELEEKINSHI